MRIYDLPLTCQKNTDGTLLFLKMTNKIIIVLLPMFLSVFFLLLGRAEALPIAPEVSGKTITLFSSANTTPIKISVSPANMETDVQIKVTGFKRENKLKVISLDSPTRLLLDMFRELPSFKTIDLSINTGPAMELRVGHHTKKVRLVLSIKDGLVPVSQIVYEPDGFTLIVRATGKNIQLGSEKNNKIDPGESTLTNNVKNNPLVASSDSSILDLNNTTSPPGQDLDGEQDDSLIFQIKLDDTDPAAPVFSKGISYYKAGDWPAAIAQLQSLVKKYPGSPHAEKAWFLLPRIYEKIYADSLQTHFTELTDRYRDAVSRFPNSPFTGETMLRIGRLYHQMKNYAEAQGYYTIAMNSSPPASSTALRAKLQIAKIFRLKKKDRQAVEFLQSIIDTSKPLPIKGEAMMALAKILYDQRAFNKSLDLLLRLMAMNAENIYKIPEMPLYLGNNHYQLGQNTQARKQLFLYYNTSPDSEDSPVTLARIGETYLREGRIRDAVRIYLFVCKRYPGSQGANISWIRLAEQQEANSEVASLIPLSSRQIYEKVYGFFMETDENDPLAMLAMLKLGVLHHKEKNYDESLGVLKKLFTKNPQGALRENGNFALHKTLESMITDAMDKNDPDRAIAIYEREKTLFHELFFAEPIFLVVARAYLGLGFEEKAMELFQQMDSLLSDKEKPEDLLYYIGRQAFQSQKMEKAQVRLALLLKKFPKGKYVGDTSFLMANCFLKKKQYTQAMDMLDAALTHDLSRCEKTKILILLAKTAIKTKARKKAMGAVIDAEKNHGSCVGLSGYLGDEIGDLFFKLGAPDKAAAVFTRVVEMEQSQVGKASLKYKIAQCFQLLDRREESFILYQEVADMNTPFWSNLARENIAAAGFSDEIK